MSRTMAESTVRFGELQAAIQYLLDNVEGDAFEDVVLKAGWAEFLREEIYHLGYSQLYYKGYVVTGPRGVNALRVEFTDLAGGNVALIVSEAASGDVEFKLVDIDELSPAMPPLKWTVAVSGLLGTLKRCAVSGL